MGRIQLPPLDWRWRAFNDLSAQELHHIHRARQAVFVIEQACLYADADAGDEQAHHLAAWSSTQTLPLAYARVLAPGVQYEDPAIGRVLTWQTVRGLGLGRALMNRALDHAASLYPGHPIRLSAQLPWVKFYGSLGFVTVGEPYLEDHIPHIEMLLRSRA